MRLRRRLRCKYKVRRRRGGPYPLSHLYGHFGLVRLTSGERNGRSLSYQRCCVKVSFRQVVLRFDFVEGTKQPKRREAANLGRLH